MARVCRQRQGFLSRLMRDIRATAAVEFALILPILAMLIIGTIEVSMIFFVTHIMESAAFSASRTGKTGYVQSGMTREATIMAAITQRAGPFIDISKVVMDTKTYTSFSQIGQPEPFIDADGNGQWDEGENYTDVNHNDQYDLDRGTEGTGSAGDIVVYTISYPWKLFTPMMGDLMGHDGTFTVSSRIVVKNEPYAAGP